MPDTDKYYLALNDDEECWEIYERSAIASFDGSEDALIARFYDGSIEGSPLASLFKRLLDNQ